MQSHRIARRKFLGPAYDEFFRILIKVFLDERRTIHRIEQLVHVPQFQSDVVRMSRFRAPLLVQKNRIRKSFVVPRAPRFPRISNSKLPVGLGAGVSEIWKPYWSLH